MTKAAGTHLCRLAAATHGQRAPTLRLYSVYGPWEDPDRLMPTLASERSMAAGRHSSTPQTPGETSCGSTTRATLS